MQTPQGKDLKDWPQSSQLIKFCAYEKTFLFEMLAGAALKKLH